MRLNAIWAFFLALLLAGCASIQPKSPAELVGATYTVISAHASTLAERYEAGAISRSDAIAIRNVLMKAYETTSAAEQLLAEGDEAGANTKIRIARSILEEVERQLREVGDEHAGSAGDRRIGESRPDAARSVEYLRRAVQPPARQGAG